MANMTTATLVGGTMALAALDGGLTSSLVTMGLAAGTCAITDHVGQSSINKIRKGAKSDKTRIKKENPKADTTLEDSIISKMDKRSGYLKKAAIAVGLGTLVCPLMGVAATSIIALNTHYHNRH